MTASHFDHVGLILRFGDTLDELYIFEAVGEDGVRLTPWINARFYLGNYFDKIGFRKLNYEISKK